MTKTDRRTAIRASLEDAEDAAESRMRWTTDDRLVGVHNAFLRLARPDGGVPLHALERLRMLHDGAVMGGSQQEGLPPDQAALLDCMAEAGTYEVAFVKVLYWLRGATAWKARKLNLTKTRFYEERSRVLFEFRGAMRSKGFRL